jgi:ribonuclease BN (tRNA processing enzyme)
MNQDFPAINLQELTEQLLSYEQRVLLLGPPGIGKSTLSTALAESMSKKGEQIQCLTADPGIPLFGLPGAINLGVWHQDGWNTLAREAFCSLDAARFRLPLIEAVSRLTANADKGTLLVDTPGVVRGVAGAELLMSLVRAARINLVVAVVREEKKLLLHQELKALSAKVVTLPASALAKRPGKSTRDQKRTRLWDEHLAYAIEHKITRSELTLLGTAPRQTPKDWLGRQVAFLDGENTVGMGEVSAFTEKTLTVLLPPKERTTPVLLVRDATRDKTGLLVTAKRSTESVVRYLPPSDLVPDSKVMQEIEYRPMVQTGSASALLMNGVFGDPLLHLRLSHQQRSLIFDLGDGSRLPAKVAHQVSDVFISHAHMDHICGFLWLLRSRIGEQAPCRLFGPPGLASQITHLINGIHWDRIGDRGPRFEVAELHGERLLCYTLQAGISEPLQQDEVLVNDGILREEASFRIRAVTLDHGIPVLAYAFEPVKQINIRKERLAQRGLEPGPWLTEFKQLIAARNLDHTLSLPNGTTETVGQLADELTLISPGSKIVYATDLADTTANRQHLIALAKGAHTLFCESSFMQKDSAQAQHTGHLTTQSCGEIAHAASVQHLVPFHFSRRYEKAYSQIYDEIAAYCPCLVMPSGLKE